MLPGSRGRWAASWRRRRCRQQLHTSCGRCVAADHAGWLAAGGWRLEASGREPRASSNLRRSRRPKCARGVLASGHRLAGALGAPRRGSSLGPPRPHASRRRGGQTRHGWSAWSWIYQSSLWSSRRCGAPWTRRGAAARRGRGLWASGTGGTSTRGMRTRRQLGAGAVSSLCSWLRACGGVCVSRGRVGGWEALGGRGVGLAETGWRLRGSWPCDGDVKLCATAPRLGCRCWAADAGLMLMSGEAVRPPRTGERPARAMTIARACCACGGAGSRRRGGRAAMLTIVGNQFARNRPCRAMIANRSDSSLCVQKFRWFFSTPAATLGACSVKKSRWALMTGGLGKAKI